MIPQTEDQRPKTGFEIIPFRVEHCDGVDWRSAKETTLATVSDYWLQRALMGADMGHSFSGFYQGKLVGSAGLQMMWPGVAVAWALFLEPVETVKVVALRAIKKGLEIMMHSLKLHRVQTAIKADWPQGRKLAEVLGFEEEGPPMKQYGPDQADYVTYVRLRCLS